MLRVAANNFLGHPLHFDRLSLVDKCGVSGDDEQLRDLGQSSDDVLGDAVANVFLIGVWKKQPT